MRRKVRLTESDLHRIVGKTIKKIIQEDFNHKSDFEEAKRILNGMDFEDVKTLPDRDPRFSFGVLNGSEGEEMIDLNFKGILVTVKAIAKVTDNYEKYDVGGSFMGIDH